MAGLLAREIHQSKPFASPSQEAVLSIIRTSEVCVREIALVLRDWDLSQSQYNILRILRGAGPDGLPCRAIHERLVTLDPDVTRLLDKLEHRGLIVRERGQADRRLVLVRLTQAGRDLVGDADLDERLRAAHRRSFAGLDDERIADLIDSLERIRLNLAALPASPVSKGTP